jgi:hypothetical protein
MNKVWIILFVITLIFTTSSWAANVEAGKVQMTLKVQDEFGKPVQGAEVGINLIKPKNVLSPLLSEKGTKVQMNAKTDKDGVAVFENSSLLSDVYFGASLTPGYYYTEGSQFHFQRIEDGKWQPWNPMITIILRPILNPVPMYAKMNSDLKLPENDKPIGYDLMVGDWVAPYGKGMTSDLTFELHRQFTNVNLPFDASLTVKFSNNGDGIQSVLAKETTGLSLRLPRTAPTNGYESRLVLRTYREEGKPIVSSNHDDQNYFFQVRSQKDDNGNIIKALYGKIHGNIEFHFFDSPNPTARLRFTYYLNPEPNSRNMEFNTLSNLFKNLSSLEQVSAP